MKSNMVHQFSQVPQVEIPRSKFQRNNRYMATFDADYLIPVFVDEMVPGDSVTLRETLFGRLNTPLVPFMDNLYLDTQYFFVPNRLLWSNWKKFMGEQTNPGDSISYLVPQITAPVVTGFAANTIYDYLGLPVARPGVKANALHMRAYNLIWNEWYRDQNLQNSITVNTGDGPDLDTDYVLKKRGKRYDYFTSSLPAPQKGTAVSIPLGTTAPVVADSGVQFTWNFGAQTNRNIFGDTTNDVKLGGATLGSNQNASWGSTTGLKTDLSTATAATINSLRQAFQIQRMLEKDMRGGTRYVESIRAHFGVISPDFRLQRPEYIGGGSSRININPVVQSSESATTPQGTLAAFGTVSANNRGFSYSATEHGVLIGLASVRADLTYQDGLDRMWSRQTRYDFYYPSFAHLGEQAVLNKEIYAQGTAGGSADDSVFGYQERYGEMRYKNSVITSAFRSSYAQSLDVWHLSQEFSSLPALNASFIESNTPLDRVVATPNEPHLKLDCWFEASWARPMPMYGVPGFIDRF